MIWLLGDIHAAFAPERGAYEVLGPKRMTLAAIAGLSAHELPEIPCRNDSADNAIGKTTSLSPSSRTPSR